MQTLKMFNYSSIVNKCIEILERGLYSHGKFYTLVTSLRECRRKKFYEIFLEYENYN